ncbi:putative acetyltransferase [Bacillus velezensis UCMB5036]|uniref:arylamine N-acetyltransferase family protein n=1 Tax=Bacillus amyloliquefaciens group TaxID=1938374 RepID=UPI0002B6D313|nr:MULTISPECIES: arylamine N-acetyltransferase [Bacillus amyloliquefaciens group]AMR51825.1 acetyltransferase [Bacillus amyloliquefaciens]MCP1460932.1 N-hydroxyarylamine O-acetyltransferase [Bacillus amyloliquefaciens]MCY7682292.1 arylamine N-acetyltransferase [Bacillus velezensis]MED3331041.1 arylamine N-acetyltransferase [Bacillus velezensis]MED3675626.1 arylamine N-acetyltransferase [Bacillus velezensis]
MNEFLKDCYQTIGWEKDSLDFSNLPEFLKALAYRFPFENRAVLSKKEYDVTKEGLWRHMVKEPHGGLCYDLNGLLYFILKDAGFDVKLIRGTVWKNGWALPGTHAAVLLSAGGNEYIADAGFGLNLAMQPVPMSGDETVSAAGAFRVRIEETEFGAYLLEMNKGDGWQTGYAFSLEEIDEKDLKSMKQTIFEHERSPFNKRLLASKRTPEGHMVLSERNITIKKHDGTAENSRIDRSEFEEKFTAHFI